MFTEKAQTLIDLAKDLAFSNGIAELTVIPLLAAIARQAESCVLLAECLSVTPSQIRDACPPLNDPVACPGKFPVADHVQEILKSARGIADEVPDRTHPGLIDIRHLVCGVAMSEPASNQLQIRIKSREELLPLLARWIDSESQSPGLQELTHRLRTLRTTLITHVYGQDHAVHAFVEGLFNAEVVASADTKRKAPRALFVFAGPPGVGKTFLAELGASYLDRPFKRFDMSAYSGPQQNDQLVGMAKSFMGAHPGTLTEFVEKNPYAVLLFDEVEKAHLNTIHLFLQLLDAGTLEDKYNERNVSFRDTTIIFTSNAGRKLYDKPNESGMHRANATFHRQTILDALENEKNPATGQSFFPAAICSRMATGYPILFNHLRVNELEMVAKAELMRVEDLFERQYYKRMSMHSLLPMCLVLREGARIDARTLRSQAETFVKTEIFNFCQLFHSDRIEDVLANIDSIRFTVEEEAGIIAPEVKMLFEPVDPPKILIVSQAQECALINIRVADVDWRVACTPEDALQIVADEDIDLVLLNLWIGNHSGVVSDSIRAFDSLPPSTRVIDKGQELLRRIRERLPNLPVYLMDITSGSTEPIRSGKLDEELFMACVRGGGARGMLSVNLVELQEGTDDAVSDFSSRLKSICNLLYREKVAERLGQERKTLSFDTSPRLDQDKREVIIRLRNLRLSRALAASDAGEVLEDVERPRISFDDVIGADGAKEELKFFIDFLRNPRRFAALGLKPPKGVLLYGPPGTGKTMLAKAMAGESNVAFISATASSFVTAWQGSGPQNVRDLFARARRYAPSIIFIDEIDAVGKVRTGGASGHGEEMALNALLTEMDGFTGPSPDKPVFVLAATNFKVSSEDQESPERSSRALDPALVRRFSRCILVGLPDKEARKRYLTVRLLSGKQVNVSPETIDLCAAKSAGMSIANIEQVLEATAREAIRRDVSITDELLIEMLDTVREGEAKEWTPEFLLNTARHEAGHTIMYWLAGWWAPEVSIIARANRGGGMHRSDEEFTRECQTRDDLLQSIRTCLGGRAAEIIYNGNENGMTTGASGDLERATQTARQMICIYGMHEEFGLLSTPEVFRHAEAISSPLYQRINELVSVLLNEQMANTLKTLAEHRDKLDAVTAALMQKNRIYRKELEEILSGYISETELDITGSDST